MATKKLTLFKEGHNYGCKVYDGDKKTTWEELTREEQLDLIGAMGEFATFFSRFIHKEDSK